MKRLITTAVLVGLAVTGCGGGSAKTTVARQASPSESAAASTPPLPTPSDLPSSAASLVAGLASGQCQEVALKFSQAATAFSSTDKTRTPSQTFALLSQAMSEAAGKVDQSNVKAAFAELAKAYTTLANGLKGVDYTPGSGTAPPPAYLAAVRSLGAPEFTAASKTVGAFFTAGCK